MVLMLARLRSAARPLAPAAALVALGLCAPSAAPAQARAPLHAAAPRVLVAFLPAAPAAVATDAVEPPLAYQPVLGRLAARAPLSLGLSSASQGKYDRIQALLDMTQGTRVSLSTYKPKRPPPLVLLPDGSGGARLGGWPAVLRRADGAPAKLRPGLLAQSVPGGAGYAGVRGLSRADSIVAADRTGRVAEISLGPARDVAERAQQLLARRAFVVAGLPAGAAGDAALDRLIALRRAGELLIVTQTPPVITGAQLLPIGTLGLGGTPAGRLTSESTHVDGIVAGIDITPTVLEHLGLPVPDVVKGQPITSEPGRDAAALVRLADRLRVVLPRRLPALWTLLTVWLVVLLAATLVADRRGLRWSLRIGPLAVLWVPSVVLITAALRPSRLAELLLVSALALAFGVLTDLLVRWPRGPAVPALAGLVAYTLDLAFGSPLIIRSLLGPNPLFGSRFYGIGNELEGTLAALLVIALGALLFGRGRSSRAVGAFAAGGLVLALIVGAGRLGADVGGVITIGAAAGAAAVMMLPGGLTRRSAAIAILAPVAGLALLAAVDLTTGGDSHFTRTVLHADGSGALWDIVARRYELAGRQAIRGLMPAVTLIAILAIAVGVRQRSRVLERVGGDAAWLAALVGLIAAGVAGSLFNDSGPVLLLFETFFAAALVLYLRADPEITEHDHPAR